MQEDERREEKRLRKLLEKDYLAPYLMHIKDVDNISSELAAKIRHECLENLRRRLVNQANLIQQKFEEVSLPLVNRPVIMHAL